MKNKNQTWNLKIKNSAERAEIWIYGNIIDDVDGGFLRSFKADEGYTFPLKIREQLDEIGEKPVNIYIASDGGDVNAGMAIANIIKRMKGETTAYIDSWAASIASVIALACDRVVIPENAFIMIHNPSCIMFGTADEMRKTADLLDTIRDSIIDVYTDHCVTKVPESIKKTYLQDDFDGEIEDMFIDLMNAETWLTAADCAAIWTHVEIAEATNKAVACWTGFKTAPEALHKPADPEPAKPEPVPEPEPAKPEPVDYSDLIAAATEVLKDGN